jgi:hypothetical protein
LKTLNIENGFEIDITHDFMMKYQGLENIKLEGGKINIASKKINWNMTSIALTNSMIMDLQPELFSNCVHMKLINISGNQLEILDLNVSKLQNIQVLDVSHNPIRYFSHRTIAWLMQKRHSMTPYLDNTDLACGCNDNSTATIQFLKDAQNKYNITVHNIGKLRCELNADTKLINESSLLTEIEATCYKSYTYLIIGLCSANVFLIGVTLATLFCIQMSLSHIYRDVTT